MRTLDFGCDLSLSRDGTLVVHNRHRLCSRLLAYLTFPEDLGRRNQFLAKRGAEFLQHELDRLDEGARECAQANPDAKDRRSVSHEDRQQQLAVEKSRLICAHFRTFGGGFGPLATAADDKPLRGRLDRGLEAAIRTGERLIFTAVMATHHDNDLDGGASLGKATDLIAHLNSKSEGPTSKNPINEAWQSHRNVAHLAAAAAWMERIMRRQNAIPANEEIPILTILLQTEGFLRLAFDFLTFGLTFRVFRSPETILDEDSVWRLPGNPDTRPLERILPPLPRDLITYLRDVRRAPIPMV